MPRLDVPSVSPSEPNNESNDNNNKDDAMTIDTPLTPSTDNESNDNNDNNESSNNDTVTITTTTSSSEYASENNNNNNNSNAEDAPKSPFFQGSVEESILQSKKTQMLFVVTIVSQENNSESERMEKETFVDSQVFNILSMQCVAIRLIEGTPEAKSFSEFFPVDKVPIIFIIGMSGLPFKILKGFISSEEFVKEFEEAKKLHVADLQKLLLQQLLGMAQQQQQQTPPPQQQQQQQQQQNSIPPTVHSPQTTSSPTPPRIEQPVQRRDPIPTPAPQLSLQAGIVKPLKREGDLERELAAATNTLVVVDFSAVWCGPCKAIAPVFDKLAKNFPAAVFLKIDVDQLRETATRCQITAMPTFHFYIGRDKVDEMRGADFRRLEQLVANWYHYVTNPKPSSTFESTTTPTPSQTTSQATTKQFSSDVKTPQTSSVSPVEKRKSPEPKISTQTTKPTETQTQPITKTPTPQAKPIVTQPKPTTTTTTQPKPTQPKPTTQQPPKIHTETNLVIRLTNGHALKSTFQVIQTLNDVADFINKNRTDGRHNYNLMTTHPRHIFTDVEMDKTLSQLDLVPSATITLTPTDPSVVPTPIPNTTTTSAKGGYSSGSGTASSNVGWGAWIKNTVTSYIPFWGSGDSAQNPTIWEHQPNPELERSIRGGNDNTHSNEAAGNNAGLTRRRGGDGKIHQLSDPNGNDDKEKNSYWNGNSTEFK